MLLYHFTSFWCVGSAKTPEKGTIWRDGIKPGTPPEAGQGDRRAALVQPHDCVWLTRETFPSTTLADLLTPLFVANPLSTMRASLWR